MKGTELHPGTIDVRFHGCAIQSLRQWLTQVGVEAFDLVGAITNRSFNIIWLMMQQMPELTNLRNCFTSDNGLMIEAEMIAQYYVQYKRFPRIAILDDILVHGRRLNQFLREFQAQVFDCLKAIDAAGEQTAIEDDFYQSITLWVFAVNKAPFSLKQDYQWRLRYQCICPESQWRRYAVSIAQFIEKEDIANTSYVISASVQSTSPLKIAAVDSGWICGEQKESLGQNVKQIVYYLSDVCQYGIYPTVRSYGKADRQYFTPYIFMEDVDSVQIVQILQRLFNQISKEEPAHVLIGFFNRIAKYPRRLHIYCQLFYLLLSQVTLSVFLSENFETLPSLDYDFQKIAHNFGFSTQMEERLASLVKIRWTREQMLSVLQPLMTAGSPVDRGTATRLSDCERDALQVNMEYKIYEQALIHEADARMVQGNNAPAAKDTGEKPITEFLSELDASDGSKKAAALSSLTMLMDQGYASLKARLRRNRKGKSVFCSSVRNTELSLAILPQRIQAYYDDFARLGQFYWRDDDFPERVESYFTKRYDPPPSGQVVNDAVKFAELICRYREIVDSILNWESVYGCAGQLPATKAKI